MSKTALPVPLRRCYRRILAFCAAAGIFEYDWIPPRGMPSPLKVYMVWGILFGPFALYASLTPRSAPQEMFFELVGRPGGRALLCGLGILALTQAALAAARIRAGLYAFWGFNAVMAAASVSYYGGRGVPLALWCLAWCVYAWWRRAWFRWNGKPGCRLRGEGQGQDGES